jgi:tetratricopeptide (TPR) repeat protein
VSADFIQSDYCFGLEMRTALERDQAGRSRVVPVIVRKCDWETAPFGNLQAVPRDNRPVATHPGGPDEALTEVAKELRRVAREIADQRSGEKPTIPSDGEAPGRESELSGLSRHRRTFLQVSVVVCLAAVISVVAYVVFSWSSSMVARGQRDLRVGAYDAAEEQFRSAVAANPFDRRAHRGLRLARLGLMIPDLENKANDFSRELDQLERDAPQDPQVLLFRGDRALDVYRQSGDPRKLTTATEAYGKAVEWEPDFAEAHARLAHVHLLQGDLTAAAEQLREAIQTSGDAAAHVPRYQHDLASVLTAQGNSGEALSLYEGNGELVLSAVEAGMLLWSMATEPEALTRARSKLAGALNRQERLRSGANQYAWFLIAANQGVYFGQPEAKVCFTTLALAAAERLIGEKHSADANLRAATEGRCQAVRADAALIVCARLENAAHVGVQQPLAGDTRRWLGCPPNKPVPRASLGGQVVRSELLAVSGTPERYLL